MRCPFCAHDNSQVKDSRPSEDGSSIRRRRQCEDCGARFTTFERIQLRELTVIKSGSRREPFDRTKLERSIAIACRKRAVPQERLDRLVSSIQRQVETSGESEIDSARIGGMVMDGLKALDPVAYIRFASVYKDFREARDFEEFAGSVSEAARRDRAAAASRAPPRYCPRPAPAWREYRQGGPGDAQFGLTDMRLVAPRDGWPNPAAGPAASGADMVLEQARVFDTVADAVADCAHIYATTVRKRGLVVPVVSPEERRGRYGGRRSFRQSCSARSGRAWRRKRWRSRRRSSPCRSTPSSAH
jgi:transcriptional repressor NrdR